jgi:dihydrolipoamide dehydrogenase
MKIIIIGGGPAGRTAAMEAAIIGEDVTLIEKEKIGGKCLHQGCMVVCGLNDVAKFYLDAQNFEKMGIANSHPHLNFKEITKGIRNTSEKIKNVLEYETKETGTRIIDGEATLKEDNVQINGQTLEYDKLLIATGSRPNTPPITGAELALNYESIPYLEELPEKMLIVGSGVIAAEYGNIFSSLGSEVIIFCRNEFLKILDPEIKEYVTKNLLSKVKILENVDVKKIHEDGIETEDHFYQGKVLLATGLKPNSEIAHEIVKIGPKNEIMVNKQMQTSHPNIYAAGDVIGGLTNTPISRMEGVVAARNACGISSTMDYSWIPNSISLYYDVSFLNPQDLENATIGTIPGSGGPGSYWKVLSGKTGMTKVAIDLENGNINGLTSISPSSRTSMAYLAKMIRDGYKTQDYDDFLEVHPSTDAIYKMLKFFGKYV